MGEQEPGIMAMFEAETHSFLLRLWQENRASPDMPVEWRGSIDHVQSGQRYYFRDFAEIGRIISTLVGQPLDPDEHVFMPVQAEEES